MGGSEPQEELVALRGSQYWARSRCGNQEEEERPPDLGPQKEVRRELVVAL